MKIPEIIQSELKAKLWRIAGEIGWSRIRASEKARQYEIWTRDPEIGGRLAHYMDHGEIRVYIKDTLLKGYGRTILSDTARPYTALGLSKDAEVKESYIKPHGRLLVDGRVFCWGRADDWKGVLMSVHERAFKALGGKPFAAILMYSAGRYHQLDARSVAEDAARKLGIERIHWLD